MYNVIISAIVGFALGVVVVLVYLSDFNDNNKDGLQNVCASETENVLVNNGPDINENNKLKEKITQLERLNSSSSEDFASSGSYGNYLKQGCAWNALGKSNCPMNGSGGQQVGTVIVDPIAEAMTTRSSSDLLLQR